MRSTRRVVPWIAAIGVAGCTPIEPSATTWEGKLQVVGRLRSFDDGSAAAISRGLNTHATLWIGGAAPGARYLWRLREGSCQRPGELVGGRAAYDPLEVGPSGSADGEAVLSGRLRTGGEYHAQLLRGTDADTTLVGCGELDQR